MSDFSISVLEAGDGTRTATALIVAVMDRWIDFSNKVMHQEITAQEAVEEFDKFMLPVAMLNMVVLETVPEVSDDARVMLEQLDKMRDSMVG